jgi:hypothetical protein
MYNKVVKKHYRLVAAACVELRVAPAATNAAALAIPCTPHAALTASQPLFAAFQQP